LGDRVPLLLLGLASTYSSALLRDHGAVLEPGFVNPVVVNMEIHLAQGSRDGLGGTDAERHLRGVGRVLAAAVQFDDLAGIGAGGDQLIRLVLVVLHVEQRQAGIHGETFPGQPGQLELGALRLGLAGVADELYRSRPVGDVDQTLLVAGLHEEEGTIQTHHAVKQIGLEAQLDVLDLLGLEGGVAGGTEVPATGHGGTAGLGIEEQVIGGLVIHADDPRRVLELGILGALAGAVGNVAIRGGDLAAGLGDAGLAGLGVLAEDLGLTLVEGVAETQGAAQVLGERVVGLGKGAVGGVVVHGVVGAERRADQRQGEVGAGGNLANAFQRQLHVAATEAVDGEVAAVFLEVVKAGDPVEIIVEVAAQLELLADLVLIPLAVEGQQLHRGAVQIHGAGRGCFPVGGDGFEVDFAEGDIDVEVDALAFVGGAGLGQAGVRRIGVDGGIVGVPVGVAELLLAEEIGGIEADAVGDDAGKAVGAGGVECHQLGALPAVLEVAPVKAQGGIEVLVHGLPADLAAGVGILVDVASFLVETVEEEAVGIGVGAVIAET